MPPPTSVLNYPFGHDWLPEVLRQIAQQIKQEIAQQIKQLKTQHKHLDLDLDDPLAELPAETYQQHLMTLHDDEANDESWQQARDIVARRCIAGLGAVIQRVEGHCADASSTRPGLAVTCHGAACPTAAAVHAQPGQEQAWQTISAQLAGLPHPALTPR